MNRFVRSALAALVALSAAGAASDRFTLDAHDALLPDVIRLLGAESGRNVVADGSMKPQRVSVRLVDVTFDEALTTLASAYDLQAHRDGRITIVGDASAMNRRYPGDATASGARTDRFALVHAHPDDVTAALKSALPDGTIVVADRRTSAVLVTAGTAVMERVRRLVTALDAPDAGAGAGTTVGSVQLHNLRATDAAKLLRGAVPENTLFPDDRQNVVVIDGPADVQALVRGLLAQLDRPGRQVMFEVRVADVEPVDDSSNVGVEFGGAGFGTGALGQFPYTITRKSIVINAQINALVQSGHAAILAQPRVATLNNREASLLVGEQYPVVTVNQQTGYPSVATVDVGVQLRVTPTIGADGSITADLHPEYSQIIGFNSNVPIIANRRLDATLRVRDGETIVLGGLFEDVTSDTVTKLPFLGDVPVLGPVFRSRQKTHNRDEVVFFITPRVL